MASRLSSPRELPRDGNGGVSWQSNLNVSTNKNKVTALYGGQPIYSGFVNSVPLGEPIGAFWTLKFLGVDPATGDALYRDVDGDGNYTANDYQIVGNPQPTYWGGITNTLAFRNFDLRAALQFSGGNRIYNGMREFSDDGGYLNDNKFANALGRWRQAGDITSEPRPSWDGTSFANITSSRWIEPGSYARLQEVTLGFRVPTGVTRYAGMQHTRLYLTGRNLHTWTKFRGYNPDVNSFGSGSNISLGTDFYAYPLARTWLLGLSGEW